VIKLIFAPQLQFTPVQQNMHSIDDSVLEVYFLIKLIRVCVPKQTLILTSIIKSEFSKTFTKRSKCAFSLWQINSLSRAVCCSSFRHSRIFAAFSRFLPYKNATLEYAERRPPGLLCEKAGNLSYALPSLIKSFIANTEITARIGLSLKPPTLLNAAVLAWSRGTTGQWCSCS